MAVYCSNSSCSDLLEAIKTVSSVQVPHSFMVISTSSSSPSSSAPASSPSSGEISLEASRVIAVIDSGEYFTSLSNSLKNIVDHMQAMTELDKSTLQGRHPIKNLASGTPPPPPPNALVSIMQLRAIYTALEIMWILAMRDFAMTKGGMADYDSLPSAMLLDKEKIEFLFGERANTHHYIATADKILWMKLIFSVCSVSAFTNMMLERNMKRIMCCLLLLKDEPDARSMLNELVSSNRYKYLIVCSLRSLLSSNSTSLKKDSSTLLTHILVKNDGLDAVLRSYLDGSGLHRFTYTTI